jgi:hypothetical protein
MSNTIQVDVSFADGTTTKLTAHEFKTKSKDDNTATAFAIINENEYCLLDGKQLDVVSYKNMSFQCYGEPMFVKQSDSTTITMLLKGVDQSTEPQYRYQHNGTYHILTGDEDILPVDAMRTMERIQ